MYTMEINPCSCTILIDITFLVQGKNAKLKSSTSIATSGYVSKLRDPQPLEQVRQYNMTRLV